MNARPMVWRTRMNGNAQIVVASRVQTLRGQFSIQRKNGSMRDESYPHKYVRPRRGRRKDELVTSSWEFLRKVESAEPRRLRQFRNPLSPNLSEPGVGGCSM